MYNDGKDVQEIDADVSTSSTVEVQEKSVFEEIKELDDELGEVYEDRADKSKEIDE